ncbi:hemolysin [Pseudomonas putida]|nr:hemolysin [Pseudomonas putida]
MQYDTPVSSTEVQSQLELSSISDNTVAAISSLLGLETVETVGIAGIVGNTVVLPAEGPVDLVSGLVAGLDGDQVVVDLSAAEAAGARSFVLESEANLVVTLQGQSAAPSVQAFAALAADIPVAADSSDIELVVATGNGDDVITVQGDQNTHVDAGAGNDTIVTGNGNNTVIAGLGNNNVTTGSGNDTIVLSGVNHADIVNTGEGYDVVQLDGSRDNYNFAAGNNFSVNLTSAQDVGQTALISGAEFLTFVDGETVESVVLARSEDEAAALRLYQGILGRDADLEGAKAFTNLVNEGTSLSDIANQFLNSAEFAGAANEASINGLYSSLLDREADEAGSDAWEAVLANGGSLADVAAAIAVSQEAQDRDQSNGDFVRDLYTSVLGREADEAGLDAWVSQLFNGTSRADVAKGIVGSGEAATKSNADFIDALYQTALDRTADDAGKAGWLAVLENGGSHADVALGIVGSAEGIDNNDNVVVLHGQV